jgi:hypothetical protein
MLQRTVDEHGAAVPCGVPPARGTVVSLLAAAPDGLIAGWLGCLIRDLIRTATTFEHTRCWEHIRYWRWWFAYEGFALMGMFLVVVFNVNLIVQNKPELKGKILKDPAYWAALGMTGGVVLAMLAKASYDMFGGFGFFGYFIAVYAVRYIGFSFMKGDRAADRAMDRMVEQGLHAMIAAPLALAAGFVAAWILAELFLDTSHPYLLDRSEEYRVLRLLCWGAAYYLIMGAFAFLTLRFPQVFTPEGLDARSQKRTAGGNVAGP